MRATSLLLVIASLGLSCAHAAEPPPVAPQPVPVLDEWTYRFVPYAWLPSMKGTTTVRGRSTHIDASFLDVLQKSNTLVGLMGDFEIRRGPVALYADIVWSNVTFDADHTSIRTPAPGVVGTVGRSIGLATDQTIIELGAAYEVFRSGAFSMDLVAGTRYWRERSGLSFDRTATVDLGDLSVTSDRAIAASGWVSWVDPLVGARLRFEAAPGHNLFLRGDVGGFGVGSRNSWQAIGGYEFDFAKSGSVTWSGIIGYRALSVDYRKGSGRDLFEFNMVQQGPVLGLGARF